MAGTIVLLSGPSSAGKTSIARELQALLDEPYLLFSMDHVMKMLPARYVSKIPGQETPGAAGLWCDVGECDGARALVTRAGPVANGAIRAIHRGIAAMAGTGMGVIVDDVLLDPGWLDDYLDALATFSVFFVTVRCSVDELQRREHARGDRPAGNALGDVVSLHDPGIHDLELDSGVLSARQCAARIAERLATPPHAFGRLRARRAAALTRPRTRSARG
jgi:chloramphenicol 3-O phosphotransferase